MIAALGVPLLFACLALCGWLFQNEPMQRLWMASVTMDPTTAGCFLLLTAGLFLGRAAGRRAGPVAVSLLIVAGLVGALKLADVLAGTRIGIDAILFHAQLDVQRPAPSRMSPNAAFCFILLSVGFLLLESQRAKIIATAQILALLAALPPALAILGYLYGVPNFYQIALFTPMALPTAMCFIAFSVYVLGSTGSHGMMAPVRDPGPGGKTAVMLLPFGLAGPVVAGWLRLLGERAGWFSLELGVAIMVMVNILFFCCLIWWNSRQLLVADQLRRAAEEALSHAATHDFLTALANRALFMERLAIRLAACWRRDTELFGVIYLDVDGFKQVNDSLGHEAGDKLLYEIAETLRGCIRSEDLVARIGGDEFAILLNRIDTLDDISHVTSRIFTRAPRSTGPEDQRVAIGLSMGVVIGESRHETAEALLHEADSALYEAKRAGKGRATVYAPPV
jgi:diguanylate cyclase (GGDEF)-like protein